MIPTVLSVAAAACALLAIAADWNERRHRAFYLLKPLTTLLILGVALSAPAHAPDGYRWLIALALAFSLAGDVCLMFPGNGWFIGGLGSFLVAHLMFVPAFLLGTPAFALPAWSPLLVLYAAALAAVLLRRAGALRVPVVFYVLALSAMALAGISRFETLGGSSGTLALVGSLLFVASDSALGVRQFLGRYRGAQALILSTYWSAIGCIAWSV